MALLLEAGGSAEATTAAGRTPLDEAVSAGNGKALALLLTLAPYLTLTLTLTLAQVSMGNGEALVLLLRALPSPRQSAARQRIAKLLALPDSPLR